MKNYTIKPYEAKDYTIWNDFINQAKNATFLFHRDFMEYHRDRFQDYSLLVFDGEKLIAILPANVVANALFSHQGLTYGGLVLSPKSKLSQTVAIFRALLQYLNANGIDQLHLKQIPAIYCDYFSEELNYLIFVCKGKTVMKHAISVISLKNNLLFSKSRRECINRGKKQNLIIREETNLAAFWNDLLIPNLRDKYNSKPVHSLTEIQLLRDRFPENIRHFNVYQHEELVCGTTLFMTKNVAKPQYIAGSELNNALGSLDYLYDFLIQDIAIAQGKTYFDFGPSHEKEGLQVVANINFWKESFGAHSLVQDFYEIPTANYDLLDTILI